MTYKTSPGLPERSWPPLRTSGRCGDAGPRDECPCFGPLRRAGGAGLSFGGLRGRAPGVRGQPHLLQGQWCAREAGLRGGDAARGIVHDFHQIDARTPVIADEVVAAGRVADLVVVSATNPDEITGVERDFVEQTVMAPGRPVIVLPYKGEATISLDEVVLGWEGGREAARATFDALPLLKKAKKVRVVRTDPQKDPSLRGSVAGADLAETLARHGVKAEAQGYPTDGQDEGQALMRCAEDSGAGLIVMGAYGHSRLAEFIFGGATRFVLNRLDRPVLMSH